MKYVPAWFPGAEFKRHALFARQLSMDMRSAPFQMVKRRMVRGCLVKLNLCLTDGCTGCGHCSTFHR